MSSFKMTIDELALIQEELFGRKIYEKAYNSPSVSVLSIFERMYTAQTQKIDENYELQYFMKAL
jgi:hypothetical protein